MAIGYIAGLAFFLTATPAAREMKYLLPLSLFGVVLNAGLLFVVFKDIVNRSFCSPWKKYLWLLIIFLFMPAIIIYLPMHGFKKR
jgi:hypothetical protein